MHACKSSPTFIGHFHGEHGQNAFIVDVWWINLSLEILAFGRVKFLAVNSNTELRL